MTSNRIESLDWIEQRISNLKPVDKVGKVKRITGLVIEAEGPESSMGDVCMIETRNDGEAAAAEVVGFRDNRVLLMPLEDMPSLHPGSTVTLSSKMSGVPVGDALIGRIIDGLGRPMDGKGPILTSESKELKAGVPNPMKRQVIRQPFQTGVRAIDSFVPMGIGQRIGIFAGSGVGKSTLLGMIARGSDADLNVICLVGERGRELREFIEQDLGEEGMARSIIIVSTSDQPAPLRIRAALMATSIAEYFRDKGQNVMFLMDSLTRFAMAQREIGLAVGEPPTSRGYTPSVFAVLPRLLERTGMGEDGSITALYTVLVEGDDMNEPISDAVRGILDGHVILSRALATANQYPPVDVLQSVSRLTRIVCSDEEVALASKARILLDVYQKNEDLINIGAYARGSNPQIDEAIAKREQLLRFLTQKPDDRAERVSNWVALGEMLS